jgi:hypothetical protein
VCACTSPTINACTHHLKPLHEFVVGAHVWACQMIAYAHALHPSHTVAHLPIVHMQVSMSTV